MFPSKKTLPFEVDRAGVDHEFIVKENLEELFSQRRSTLYILPSLSRKVLVTAQNLPGCCVAGGAALSLYTGDINKIKDWDLFFTGWEDYNNAIQVFKGLEFKKGDNTRWSQTFFKAGVIVQLIHYRFCSSVEEIFRCFDFSVCCFAIDGPDIKYTKQAAEDVANNEMHLVYTDDLVATIKRIARYGQKGFKPTTKCVQQIISAANGCDPNLLEDSPGCS
jgi:hypothetical protein